MRAPSQGLDRRRLTWFYAGLAILVVAGLTVAFAVGAKQDPEPDFSGRYRVEQSSGCLGRTFDLRQSGQFASISSLGGVAGGSVRMDQGRITGVVECVDDGESEIALQARAGSIDGAVDGRPFASSRLGDAPPPESQNSIRPTSVVGTYHLAPDSLCLGSDVELSGTDRMVELSGDGEVGGNARYESGRLQGSARCVDGSRATISGEATDRTIQIELALEDGEPGEPAVERIEATESRDLNATVAAFLLALIVVMAAARLLGGLAVALRQPRVMGEVVAGIALGPTVLGAVAPELSATLFPSDLISTLGVVANLGVIFYMFMVGVEVDFSQLRDRIGNAVAISNGSLALPLVLGVGVAVPLYGLVGPDVGFTEFALFMGVAMSITAFPVLARILAERRLLDRPIGATALAAAAIDDVSAWFLIALGTAFATAGSSSEVARTIGLAVAFSVAMLLVVRPLLARAFADRAEERLSSTRVAGVLAGVLLAAYVTEAIGIAVIFGAFLAGLVMPRDAKLTRDAVGGIAEFVVLLLLPVFFAYTGLRTNFALLDDPELWLIAGGLLVVAIVGKFGGAMAGGLVSGLSWRSSAILGTLMNTRGLTELIALNLALDLGVISEALFTALVLMALITTFMAGPLLNLFERGRPLSGTGGTRKTATPPAAGV